MMTVYFDTSFYVDLAHAEDALASSVLHALNDLNVRGVFSFDIMRELVPHTSSPEKDARLVGRLKSFSEGFLYLDRGTWEALLLRGEARKQEADKILEVRRLWDSGTTWGLSAQDSSADQDVDELIEANRERFLEAGLIGEDGQFDLSHLVQALRDILPHKSAVPTAIRYEFQQLINQTREAAENLANAEHRSEGDEVSRKMNQALGEFGESSREKLPDYWHAKRAEEEGAAGDPRPREYVMQPGEKQVPRRLSNTYRDWGHIGRFVANRAEIDFLQVDKAQFNRLTDVNRTGPSQLSEYGLQNRVFTAKLEGVADELARRKS